MPETGISDDELRQVDLSHLAVGEMTVAQRSEIRRRYADFIKRLAKPSAPKPVTSKTPTSAKWVPGMKAAK